MNGKNQRNLSNSFRAVRLLALHALPRTADQGAGPFLVVQEGLDPGSLDIEPRPFILTRRGTWIPLEAFEPLGWEEGRDLALFPGAADVIALLGGLPSRPVVELPPEPNSSGSAPPGAPTPPAQTTTTTHPSGSPDAGGFHAAMLRAIRHGEPP